MTPSLAKTRLRRSRRVIFILFIPRKPDPVISPQLPRFDLDRSQWVLHYEIRGKSGAAPVASPDSTVVVRACACKTISIPAIPVTINLGTVGYQITIKEKKGVRDYYLIPPSPFMPTPYRGLQFFSELVARRCKKTAIITR